MSAYLIAQVQITDPEKYEEYRRATPELRRYGGKYLIKGGQAEVLEGSHDGRRLIVLEFPSMEDIRAYYNSPEYVEARRIREGAAVMDMWAVPGV